jgi:hypothetical protein
MGSGVNPGPICRVRSTALAFPGDAIAVDALLPPL